MIPEVRIIRKTRPALVARVLLVLLHPATIADFQESTHIKLVTGDSIHGVKQCCKSADY